MPYRIKTHRPPRLAAPDHSEQLRNRQPHRKLLSTARYRRFRKWLLAERPVCERCGIKGATDVHHRRKLADHPEDLCDQEHCECLCHECHSRLTQAGE
jgi:hypothetical protein